MCGLAARGKQIVPPTIDQCKFPPSHGGKCIDVVAYDRPSAAPLRTVRRKRADDDMPAWADGLFEARNVSLTISRVRQEMERGPVVPEIVTTHRVPSRNIRDNPLYLRPGPAPAVFAPATTGGGEIARLGSTPARARCASLVISAGGSVLWIVTATKGKFSWASGR